MRGEGVHTASIPASAAVKALVLHVVLEPTDAPVTVLNSSSWGGTAMDFNAINLLAQSKVKACTFGGVPGKFVTSPAVTPVTDRVAMRGEAPTLVLRRR